jgi:Dyp-type peroxidase family
MRTASVPSLDLADVQGFVKSGYTSLGYARYLMYAFGNGSAGSAFLSTLLPAVTRADQRNVSIVTQVALTSSGLAGLGLNQDQLALFSQEFTAGMTTPARSHFLGDIDDHDPSRWSWGGPRNPQIDVLVLCFAATSTELDEHTSGIDAAADRLGLTTAARLDTQQWSETEPFGFRDGISQPFIAELSSASATRPTADTAVELGEFLLGYPNAYGNLTDRPVLPAAADPGHVLPSVDPSTNRAANTADLGRNGTYLVFRSLRQDVAGFRAYLDQAAGATGSDAASVAAKFVGRWAGGAPLALSPDGDRAELSLANDFGYAQEDPDGVGCPLGAHVRRANPRDFIDGQAQHNSVTNRHRLLRRGRKFGTGSDGMEAVGLHFIALNANLSRQYEFVQHSWINNPKFNGLYDDIDPISGVRADGATSFTVQGRPIRTRYRELPAFVTTEGGAYFFLPGLQALAFLAGLATTAPQT